MSLRLLVVGLGAALLSLAWTESTVAQVRPPDTTRADTSRTIPPEAVRPSDTTGIPSRPGAAGSDRGPSSSSDEAVHFSAQDSLVIVTDSAGNQGSLHGEAQMQFQGASLRSRTIEMNFESGTVQAFGPPSDTAQNARPIFERSDGGQGGQSFTGEILSFNVNTERGRVETARSERQQGFVEGDAIKVFEDSTLFVREGSYTTCNCPPGENPSYSLRSDEMKVQDKWVFTGPIRMFLFNVPTPLWLPFGFLPSSPDDRRSGPLSPDYGEDRRGFFIKDWGWYFALNEFTDLALRGGIWSQGSFEVRPRFRYRKRHRYNGDLQVTLQRERIGEEEDPNFQNRLEGQIRWSHSQTLSPTASLNGNIDLTTSSDFSQRNSDSFEGAVQQDVSSSFTYRKQWAGGERDLNLSGTQQQQFQTDQADEVRLSLPNVSFSQNQFKPFSRERAVRQEEKWYEKITTSYSLDVDNTYNFRPRNPEQLRARGDTALANRLQEADIAWYEAIFNRDKFELATGDDERFDFQAVHDIPVDATFRIDRYNLSITPSFDYSSDWRINAVRVVADSSGPISRNALQTSQVTVPEFHTRHDFSTSLSANAEAFGTFPVAVGPFEGLRHRLSPNLSASYRPNFNAPFWGRTQVLRDSSGTPVIDPETGDPRRFDVLDGTVTQSSTEQRRINFSVRNTFETKHVRVDSTGERETNRITLLNLDLRGLSYNLAADSFKVGDNIQLDARTTVERFDINFNTTFSPYVLRRRGGDFQRADQLMITESPWSPARLTSLNLNISGDFSSGDEVGGTSVGGGPQRGGPSRGLPQNRRQGPGTAQSGSRGRGPRATLPAFDLPWSLSFDFNYRFRKPRKEVTSRTATVSTNFSLGLTPRWQIQGRAGYDFIDSEISTTRISMSRAVGSCECWVMSFSWVPFGRFQSYSFNLQVKSSQLSQLLRLQLPRDSGEGRFGGFGDQLQNSVRGNIGGGRFP